MKEELRCPHCNMKLGQVNDIGNVIARIKPRGKNGATTEHIYLKNEEIKIKCCDRITVFRYDGYVVTVTPLSDFIGKYGQKFKNNLTNMN